MFYNPPSCLFRTFKCMRHTKTAFLDVIPKEGLDGTYPTKSSFGILPAKASFSITLKFFCERYLCSKLVEYPALKVWCFQGIVRRELSDRVCTTPRRFAAFHPKLH